VNLGTSPLLGLLLEAELRILQLMRVGAYVEALVPAARLRQYRLWYSLIPEVPVHDE